MPSSSPPSRRPLAAAQALRGATAAAHDEVDALFSQVDLSTGSGYRAFLSAQAGAHLPIEAALDGAGAERLVPDWPERRRAALLRADLADLDVEPAPVAEIALAGAAEIAGAIYVLEGSRLGGTLLRRSVGDGLPVRFLSAPAEPGAWRTLLLRLDGLLADEADLGRAVAAARAVFGVFAASGRQIMEPVRG